MQTVQRLLLLLFAAFAALTVLQQIRYGMITTDKNLWQRKGGEKGGTAVNSKYNIYPIPNTELTANPNLYNENY